MEKDLSNYKSIGEITKKLEDGEESVRSSEDRFPTLHEVLYRQTKQPVDLWSFYCYMRDSQRLIDYLDFWLDSSQHLVLCQRYVMGLKQKLIGGEDHFRSHADEILEFLGTPDLKHKSMSSSMLLEMIMNDNILDENDSHRLSSFLRGERGLIVDNPEIAEYIDTLNRQSMTSEQLLNELNRNSGVVPDDHDKRISTINPKMLEYFIAKNGSNTSFITRDDIRKSAREIFLNYFNQNSIKYLQIPERLHRKIVSDFENGRDDPEIFNEIRNYVFKVMENELFPGFLTRFGITNIPVQIWRLFTSAFLLFVGFWVSYTLIFLNYTRSTRCVVIVPYSLLSYFFFSYLYSIDPVLCWCRYGYSTHTNKYGLVPIRDHFVRKVLTQRSLWVMALVVLLAALLSVLFIFVPGRRL